MPNLNWFSASKQKSLSTRPVLMSSAFSNLRPSNVTNPLFRDWADSVSRDHIFTNAHRTNATKMDAAWKHFTKHERVFKVTNWLTLWDEVRENDLSFSGEFSLMNDTMCSFLMCASFIVLKICMRVWMMWMSTSGPSCVYIRQNKRPSDWRSIVRSTLKQ